MKSTAALSNDDVHVVGRNASHTKPAKFLVFLVKDKGAPVLVPANNDRFNDRYCWWSGHRGATVVITGRRSELLERLTKNRGSRPR